MDDNLTSQELQSRLAEAEGIIAALRNGEVDAVLMQRTIMVLRLKDVEDELLRTQRKLEQRVLEGTTALAEAKQQLRQERAKRARAEEALRESEERLRVAFEHAGLILAQTDLESRYIRMYNPHPDFDPTGVIGQRDDEIAYNEGTCRLLQMKRQVMTTGIGARIEIAFPVSNGVRHYDLLVEPLHDAAGQVIGAITSAADITDRKQTEEELQRAAAARRVKSQFVADFSHALLSSLNAIASAAQRARRPPDEAETGSPGPDIMPCGAEQLVVMLNDLLDFSTNAADPSAVIGRPFDARRVSEAVIASLRMSAETKGLTLICDYAPDLPAVVSGDELHLQHILLNLLRNAITFTEHGGVTLRVRRSGTNLRFAVEDTGVGIPAEQSEAIFEPFDRLSANSSQLKGTGIGLSISRVLARLMRSELRIWSTVGQGSAFWFDLALPAVEADYATVLTPEIVQSCPGDNED